MVRATVCLKCRRTILWLALCGALTALLPARTVAGGAPPTPHGQTCSGDCNGDMEVSVDEIIKGVNIGLGFADVSTCPAMDSNHDLEVTINELITAVANALNGCPTNTPTPTPLPLATGAPTARLTPTVGTGNRPPTAVDDAAATLVGEAVHIVVLANDTDPNGDLLHLTNFTQPTNGTVSLTGDVPTYTPSGSFSGTDHFTYMIGDGRGGSASATVTIVVNLLPPDPATVAPPPASGVATIVADATTFLYSGANPVQFGVAAGTIEPIRAAVVRGKVKTRAGSPLPGVRITILDHPELGFTVSRADGMFDLALNGGGVLTINYEKTGFCPVQRTLNTPWQDYVMAPDVVMIGLDPIVTAVTLGNSGMQVAQGSMQSDTNGSRHATLLFPPGTTATLVMPDGSTETMSSLSVRATEFTVGANGPQAMPAVLPPTSAYTYCVELSADEAMNAGAMMVAFNQPVINYVENFLKFPIGIAVPIGFYDRQKAAWVPSPNGRVIKILGITGGLAAVDTDGDNVADDGLGITSEERQNLARLYASGQSLWRMPIPHFSVFDANWGFLPGDARTPGQSGAGPDNDAPLECPAVSDGSIIECDNQVLGESLPIVGTPYSINYRSDREPGRVATRSFTLSGASVSASLTGIEIHLSVGGRTFDHAFPPNPNQQFTFVWDRKDAYGRTLLGGQPLTGSIDYKYPVSYGASNTELAFGIAGGAVLLENPGVQEFTVSQPFATVIGEGFTDARVVGLGGWTLSIHHFYDPGAKVLHTGDGRRRRAENLATIIETALTAPNTRNNTPNQVKVAPNGSLYVSSNDGHVYRVAVDGTVSIFAGGGNSLGDGGPATSASLLPFGLALGPDGSVYIGDRGNRIRRVGPDGIITTVAGNGVPGFSGDGGPATQAAVQNPFGVAVGPDGGLYIADSDNNRIRRVGPDGIITTVAGNGASDFSGDGGPAIQATINSPFGLALGVDGSLYVADGFNHRIRRIGPDGIITTVAGDGVRGFSGDGVPATQAHLQEPFDVALGPDGTLYIADLLNHRVRAVRTDGTIFTVAGSGQSGVSGDAGPATLATINFPRGVGLAPDGSLYIADSQNTRVRHVRRALPGFTNQQFLIASNDGSELYGFDGFGRHLRTLNALTGATLYEFSYDADGQLAQVTEKTGGTDNVTTIQHDGAGNPTAIIGPFGQQTKLGVDANGFLASMRNPATEQTQLTSDTNGLLTSLTDPRGKTSIFNYDAAGHLLKDIDAGGGFQTLINVTIPNQSTVTRTTALARMTTYKTENLSGHVQKRTITAPDGTQVHSEESIDAATTHATSSDATVSDLRLGPDPRFGMQSPVATNVSLQFPSALHVTATTVRSAVLANSADPLSLVSLTEADTLDGRTASTVYTASTRTYVNTTPEGRVEMFTLDALGRVVQGQHGNLNPVHVAYDDRGRLESISSGSGMDTRSYSYTYNAQGFVETVTDPIGRSVHITNDAAGRVINKTLPDGRLIEFGYDAAGNVTSLTPPGRPAHTLSYSDRGELTIINPPAVPGSGPTTRTYDPDQQLTTGARPDSQTVAIGYDSAGRQNRRVLATGGVTNAIDTATYDPAGLVSSIATDSGVATSYAYDGNLLTKESWTGTIAGDVSRTLNASLRLASQSVNGTNSVTFDYDNDDLLIGVGDLTISRDAQHGLRTGSSIGTISTSIGYDGFGELTNYIATASGTAQFGMRFTRDGLGRISQKTETVAGLTSRFDYSYDLSGQIATIIKNGAVVESYDYDGNGNRTTATVGGTGITATYDDQDRLTLYGGTSYTYNGAGDLHTRTTGAQVTACDYDQVGNLLRVILPDGTVIAYIVDALDRRIGKKVNGTLVQGFLYGDNLRPLAQLDGTGMVMSRFVYASGTVPAYMIKGGASFRLITDQVGSVRLVINAATGAIAQRMDYDSFGNVLLDTNPGFQPFGFAGGLYDTDTKLVRFGARDYDAETGRWTTKDPVSFGGGDANLYRYVRNDPVNRIDPTGTSEKTRLEREIALEAEFLQDLQGHRPPPGGNTLSLVEQEQWILDWRVKRSVVEIYEAEQTERFARLRRLNRRLKQGGAVLTVAVAAISCYGISARAQAAGKTPVQQFDDEGRKDFQADIQDVKKYFVDPVVDFVSGAFAGIL